MSVSLDFPLQFVLISDFSNTFLDALCVELLESGSNVQFCVFVSSIRIFLGCLIDQNYCDNAIDRGFGQLPALAQQVETCEFSLSGF